MNPQEQGLSPEKKELLARMLARAGHTSTSTINTRKATGPQPLSAAQERMFFLDRYVGGANNYIMSIALRIKGALDEKALEGSLREIVRRHEILRTVFQPVNGKDRPSALVRDASIFRLDRFDLSDRSQEIRESEVRDRAARLDRTPIDLIEGPPLRAVLLKLAEKEYVFLINLHHIVADGWSLNVIAREASVLYADFRAGRPSSLPEPLLQYADFARREREEAPAARTESLAYWRTKLNALPRLQFPARSPGEVPDEDRRGASVPITIGPELRARLAGLAREEQATLFMLLLSVFQLLLYTRTGAKDFAVGAPIAQRLLPGTAEAVGLFINTLVFRANIVPEKSFRAYLRSVRETTLEAFRHQNLPFDALVRELAPERHAKHNPLFQTIFMLQNGSQPGDGWQLEDLEVRQQDFDLTTTRLPLELHLWEQPQRIEGFLLYDSEHFDRTEIQTTADLFTRLLETLSARADHPLNTIDDLAAIPTPSNNRSQDTTIEFARVQATGYEPNQPGAQHIETLCAIWAEILGRPDVAPDDNFFQLGGHSLIAMRLATTIRERLGRPVEIRDVFMRPTPRELAQLLDAGAASPDEPRTQQSANDESTLSFAQESLWFLDQTLSRPQTYNMPLALRLTGEFSAADHTALEKSLGEILRRHASLRTRIIEEGGTPRGMIAREDNFSLPLISNDPGVASESRVSREAERPFALHANLFRAQLFEVSAQEHILLLNLHHGAGDGWSLGILTRELKSFFENASGKLLASDPAPVPARPATYTSYAREEREQDWQPGLAYWRRKLKNAQPTSLPPERAIESNGKLENRGDAVRFRIPGELKQTIQDFAREQSATPFMVCLAAFQLLLYRHTNRKDIVVGTPQANRTKTYEDTIGLFVNMLAIRSRVSGHLNFTETLRRLRRGLLADFARADVPFEKIVAAMNPRRDEAYNPLFQTVFALNPPDLIPNRFGSLTVEPVELPITTSKFDLELYLTEQDDGYDAVFIFRSDLYRSATIKNLAADYRAILAECVERPRTALNELTLAHEPRLADYHWPTRTRTGSGQQTVLSQFERQARLLPEAIALETKNRRFSYRELNQAAAALAAVLREQGLTAGSVVAVRMNDFADRLNVLLAILKLGAAYLLLDADLEHEAIRALLDESKAKFCIRDGQAGATRGLQIPVLEYAILAVEARGATTTLSLSSGRDPAAALAIVPVPGDPEGERPRCIQITHQQVLRLTRDGDLLELHGSDGIARTSDMELFPGLLELWVILLRGARIIDIDRESARKLRETIDRQRASILLAPGSRITQLIAGDEPAPGSLRTILVERATNENYSEYKNTLRQVRESTPGLQLVQVYRPAKFPVPLFHRIKHLSGRSAAFPFGRPAALISARLLDPDRRPVPAGGRGTVHFVALQNEHEVLIPTDLEARVDRLLRLQPAPSMPDQRHLLQFRLAAATQHTAVGTRDITGSQREDAQRRLQTIWRRLLGRETIQTNESFFDLGGHSLLAVRLLAQIRAEFARDLGISSLFTATTIEAQAALLTNEAQTTIQLPLVPITLHGQKPPLFLVHPGGGSPLCYIPLARQLQDRPVFGLQARGLEPGESPLQSIHEMALSYIAALKTVRPKGPYHIGGWSAGGLIAFEMARLLKAEGDDVGLLAMIDASVPDAPASPGSMLLSLFGLAANLLQLAPPRSTNDLRQLLRMLGVSLPENLAELGDELGNFLIQVARDLPRFLPVYREIFLAAHHYRPEHYPGSATLFLSRDEALPGLGRRLTRSLQKFTKGNLRIVPTSGNHMTLLDENNAANLARGLTLQLDALENTASINGTHVPRETPPTGNGNSHDLSAPGDSSRSDEIPSRLPAVYSDRTAHMARWFADMEFTLTVELDGQLNIDRLRRALRLTLDVHPVLGCNYVDGIFQPHWERRRDLDTIELCEIQNQTSDDRADAEARLRAFTARPAPVEDGPLLRALLLRATRDILCVKFNHIATDGRGAREVLETIVSIYRRLEQEPNYIPHTNLTPRDWKALGASLGPDGWLRALERFREDQKDNFKHVSSPWRFPTTGQPAIQQDPRIQRSFAFETITGPEYEAIQAYRRRMQTGLNDVMIAAYVRALHNVIRPPEDTEMRIALAVDLRTYLNPRPRRGGVPVSNLASFAYPSFGDSMGSSIDATTRRVDRVLGALKNEMMGLGDWAAYQLMPEALLSLARIPSALLAGRRDMALPPVLSVLPFYAQNLNFGDTRATSVRFFGHLLRSPNFMVTITMLERGMTLNCAFQESSIEPALVKTFLQDVKHEALARTPLRSPFVGS